MTLKGEVLYVVQVLGVGGHSSDLLVVSSLDQRFGVCRMNWGNRNQYEWGLGTVVRMKRWGREGMAEARTGHGDWSPTS